MALAFEGPLQGSSTPMLNWFTGPGNYGEVMGWVSPFCRGTLHRRPDTAPVTDTVRHHAKAPTSHEFPVNV
jgi:hypothetical protein